MNNATIGILARLLGANIIGLARSGERGSDLETFGLDLVLSNGEKKTLWILSGVDENGSGGFSLEDTK